MLLLLQILLSIVIGSTLGIITGLTPGIHINLISLSILSLSPLFLKFTTPLILSIIIVAMAVTHTFLDTIPSIFLGAPDSNNVMSILPGHKLLLQGKGYEGVILTLIGSLCALILCISLIPILIPGIKILYPLIKNKIGYILIIASMFLILKETRSRLWALIIFLLAGILGIIILTFTILKNPLFPLLSGLFGISTLFLSLNAKTKIPKQTITFPQIEKSKGIQAVSTSVITGSICSILPGMGPSQAAIISSQFSKNITPETFLVVIGGLSTVNMITSFITLYAIDKARNGAVITISKIIENLNSSHLTILIASSLVTAGLAVFLALNISKIFSKLMNKINYKKLCLFIISIIITLSFILSGFLGLLVLTTATLLGMIPPLISIKRSHLMGCLLLPIILFFLL